MTPLHAIGLLVFLVVWAGTGPVLLYNLWRLLTGRITITSYCYSHPGWGILILWLWFLGVMGLCVHLYPGL